MPELPTRHHQLTVDRTLGAMHLLVDLPLRAPWTLLFGSSGSGKSSLLRAACGLLGQQGVRFSRQEAPGYDVPLITRTHSTPPHRLGLGYAPQQGALFPHLSVAENVEFGLAARGVQQKRNSEANSTADLLELFELVSLRNRMPQALSGGERQRVNLARAFAVPHARLLLLDEPFAGLGRELRDRLLLRMQDWTQQHGVPVLSVSHDVDEALLLDADVVVLDDGKIARRGPASEALRDERERMLRALAASP